MFSSFLQLRKSCLQSGLMRSSRLLGTCVADMDASLTSKQIRQAFIDYFVNNHKHVYVHSSSTIPRDDPTLQFVNAGMNQFKPIFQGRVEPHSEFGRLRRVVNSQKCIRAGGKHNDLDDVGKDTFHHTFFEMLGSWSFGDYFKREAIEMAWDLLTRVYGVPKERLYVTYFGGSKELNLDPDDECRKIWLNIGISPKRVLPFGMKDNFWEMGDVGPCGPCTEIHFDRIGERDASSLVNKDDPNVVELWNIVFMQYDRDAGGELKHLPNRHVDTGMGLERIVSVIQNKDSNYDTDVFLPYFNVINKATGIRPYMGRVGAEDIDRIDMAYRIVADHIRTLSVAICDGCRPGDKRWENILQQITRRGIFWCNEKLQGTPGLFSSLVHCVVDTLGDAYPEVKKNYRKVIDTLNEREKLFMNMICKLRGEFDPARSIIPGEVAWRLYEDKISIDLMTLMAEDRNLTIDWKEFELLMQRAQIGRRIRGKDKNSIYLDSHAVDELQRRGVPCTSDFPKHVYTSDAHGNYEFESCEGTILALRCNNKYVSEVGDGELAGVVLDKTCFHAEQGGQIADEGFIVKAGEKETQLVVADVKTLSGYVVHIGAIQGRLKVGDKVVGSLNESRRTNIMRSHTAAHALNFALRKVVGETEQKGSLITSDRLQFDYTAKRPMSDEQIIDVEKIVNDIIEADSPIFAEQVPLSLAKRIQGVRLCITEAYPDPVRVVSIGVPIQTVLDTLQEGLGWEHSIELCGGTHLHHARHIKHFVVVRDEVLSKGVRRVVALSGNEAVKAHQYADDLDAEVDKLCSEVNKGLMNASLTFKNASVKIEDLSHEISNAEISPWKKTAMKTTLKTLRNCPKARDMAKNLIHGMSNKASSVLVEVVDMDGKVKDIDYILGQLKSLSPDLVAMLFCVDRQENQVICHCQVPKSVVKSGFTASEWIRFPATVIGGTISGGVTFAKCSGTNIERLSEAMRGAQESASTLLTDSHS